MMLLMVVCYTCTYIPVQIGENSDVKYIPVFLPENGVKGG